MAEMETSATGGHKNSPGIKKSKKLSTRIDLTPMVDLGFLLITFFMYTTTLARPKSMEINMPFKDPKVTITDQPVKRSVVLTVLLSKQGKVYYYEDEAPALPSALKVAYSDNKRPSIRDAIIAKEKMVDSLKHTGTLSPKDQTTVLIKPDTTSTYSDMISILDEMNINEVKVYAIVDITDADRGFIKATEAAGSLK